MASKGRLYRSVEVEGFEVLIGRGARENDTLTFRVADKRDCWMHVGGGTPGSHVVIRNPDDEELPSSVIKQAAGFAAWHSKARNARSVDVHYCRVADVRKPRSAPAGQVELTRFKNVRVTPTPPPGSDDPLT